MTGSRNFGSGAQTCRNRRQAITVVLLLVFVLAATSADAPSPPTFSSSRTPTHPLGTNREETRTQAQKFSQSWHSKQRCTPCPTSRRPRARRRATSRPSSSCVRPALPSLSTLTLTLTLTQGASTTVVGDKMYLFVRPFHLSLGCRCSCSHRAAGSSPSAAWSPTCTSSTSRPSCGRACPRTRTTPSPVRATSTAPTPVSLLYYYCVFRLFCVLSKEPAPYRSATFARFIHMAHRPSDSPPGNGRTER